MQKDGKIFNIDSIIEKASLKKGQDLSKFIAQTLKEPEIDLIKQLGNLLGDKYMIHFFERVMSIQNNEGMYRKDNNQTNTKRTSGGILFYLIKTNEKENLEVKKLFKNHMKKIIKEKKLMKRIVKNISEININVNN